MLTGGWVTVLYNKISLVENRGLHCTSVLYTDALQDMPLTFDADEGHLEVAAKGRGAGALTLIRDEVSDRHGACWPARTRNVHIW